MKKRISALFLAISLLLSLSGCVKSDIVSVRAKEWGYFNFQNLEWGMTEAEVLTALKREKSDLEYLESDSNAAIIKNISAFGKKLDAQLAFGSSNKSPTPRLAGVKLLYRENFTEKECTRIMNDIDKLFETQKIPVEDKWAETSSNSSDDDGSSIWYEKESIADMISLPQEVQDSYNTTVREFYKSGDFEMSEVVDIDKVDDIDFIKAQNRKLSKVSIIFFKDTNSGQINFNGNVVREVLNYSNITE